MSNVQIPNLPAATGLNGSEQYEGVQSGTSVRISTNQIAAYINAAYPAPGISSVTGTAPIAASTVSGAVTISLNSQGVTNSFLAPMAAGTVKANVGVGSASPSDATVSQVLDVIGSTKGNILYRDTTSWAALTGGSNGQVLTAHGSTAVPTWETLSVPSGQIAPTGVVAGTYGSASVVPQYTVLASGQLSAASNVPIVIPYTSVTGLGSMATQNANNVAITGGTIDGTTIGGTTPAPASVTTLTATGATNLATIASGTWNGSVIGVTYGGTGASTASGARTNLGAAASGANSDITSLSGLTTPLSAPQGGTGFGSFTTGDLLYADTSSTLARLNDVATGNALISGGVGVAPSWGKIGLTTHVSGTLPVANGGTGITSFGTGVATALGQNVTGSGGIVLQTSPTLTTPNLGTPSAAVLTNATGLPLTTGVTGTLPVANGGTGAATLTGFLKGNGTSAFTAQATIGNSDLTNSSLTIGTTTISLGGTATTLGGLTTVTLTQDPTAALQAATKQYVDNEILAVSNTTFHATSDYATTADLGSVTYSNGTGGVGATITQSGAASVLVIDGYTFTATDVTNGTRVLVKNQSSGLQNGIYTVTNQGSGAANWQLTRATDFDTVGTGPNRIETGASTFVTGGAANGSTGWVMNTTGTITVGTTALVWVQSSSSASVTVTSPLQKAGSVISLTTVPVNLGGTNLTSYTQYGLLYAPTTGSLGQIGTGTSGYPLLSGGSGAAPAFSQLSLAGSGITGTLGVANGGTGITSFGTGVATALGQNVTGSGGIVLATSPTLTTPNLGTPSAATLTNATGLPLTTGVTGTLGVANGGTGTATAFTAGSVVFAGTSGVYSQNNSKFFWDNTNIRLGINTGAPNANMTIVSNTQTAAVPSAASLPAGTDLYIMGANAANTRITQDAYGTGNYAAYTGRQARGTAAAPTASQTDDILVEVTGRGYGATAFSASSVVRIDLEAAENFTDTAQGTYISFHTTALGATSAVERFRIGPSGQLGIGGATYGTSGYVLTSAGASSPPTWSQVSASSLTGVLPVANGGTNISSYTIGDLIYASGTTTLSKLADVATGNALISGGVGVAPSWGKIGLTTHVSGTLPVGNGGTGLASTPTDGQLLIGSTAGSGYSLATLTASTGISVTNGAGTITIANTGVTSLTAGTNISLSGSTGGVTINTTTTPTWTSETVPLISGGTTASSTLTLQSTSGAGTSDAIIFKTASQSERMRIDTSGNVGIGVTPAAWPGQSASYYVLQSGKAAFYDAGGTQARMSYNAYVSSVGTNTYISTAAATRYDQSAGQHLWYTATSGTAGTAISFNQSMKLDTNAALTLVSPINTTQAQVILSDTDGRTLVVRSPNSGTPNAAEIGTTTAHDVKFLTNNTERMRIDSSGNVGIATTTMNGKLNVDTTGGNILHLNSTNVNGGYVTVQKSGVSVGYVGTAAQLASGSSSDFCVRSEANLVFSVSSSEKMRIDSSGNALIGTTTTRNRLTVSGTAVTTPTLGTASGTTFFCNPDNAYGTMFGTGSGGNGWIQQQRVDGTGTAYDLWLQPSGGNVAIGRTSTSGKLDVEGAGVFRGFLTATDAIKLGGNTSAPSSTDAFIYRPADNTLAFGTNSTERMRIDSSGNVGIGVTPTSGNYTLETSSSAKGAKINTVSMGRSGGDYPYVGYNFRTTGTSGSYTYDASDYAAAIRYGQSGGMAFLAASSGAAGNAITWNTLGSFDSSGNLAFNSGYGSVATAYGCRAWLNYNLSTQTTRGSANVSSVTYNSTGYFTINFTNSMPDANYALAGMGEWTSGTTSQTYPFIRNSTPPTTTTCPIVVSSNGFQNPTWLTIMIVR